MTTSKREHGVSLQCQKDDGSVQSDVITPLAVEKQLLHPSAPAMVQSIDASGNLLHVSDAWLQALGYERTDVLGRPFADLLTPESREFATGTVIPSLFSKRMSGGDVEYQILRKDGSVMDVLVSAVLIEATSSAPAHTLTILHDVSESRQLRLRLFEKNEQLQVTLNSICNGIVTVDGRGRIVYMNPAAEKLTGWSSSQAQGKHPRDVVHLVDLSTRKRISSLVEICLGEEPQVAPAEMPILIGKDRRERMIKQSASPMRNASGGVTGAVLSLYDLSAQYRLTSELRFKASHDSLTELSNRDEFESRLELLAAKTALGEPQHAVMFIDLDQFKMVNDTAGHAAGDQLLRQIAGILRRLVGKDDTVARLGGDEFGLIVEDCSPAEAKKLAKAICERIGRYRFQHDEHKFRVGASIGLVCVIERWSTAATLLRAADGACFAAKEGGRNRVHVYASTDKLIELHQADVQWVNRIENALDTGSFALLWQQICPLQTSNNGIHCEILLRMADREGELTSPGAFLPSAERHHIINRIDYWVIKRVFDWMTANRERLAHVDTIAINLSGLSIGDVEFHRDILALLEATDFDHHKLCFEVTETAAITNLHQALTFIEAMRRYGVRFALDDFGSGVSSFAYLKTLPVDYLKIDGQFIQNLDRDAVDQATVRCIQDIAAVTGMKTIAEFVEDENVETILRGLGVDYTQGFLRHRPAPLDQMLATSGLRQLATLPT
ncbi:EAL domain-containing protein [Paraburkholderia caledonica]|uniref:Diguanylate cyclase (GGDEF)-like protein/PAS domain S-box-containing protein n=1 Tax=Paraburkholderia caledonica TaxID=134536 RepID=A0ABU1KZ23_9BURK|nr:EAL domain-containing protein [Paraburkholderia caledonica]MDR6376168.1 diguanylate cyclase (GGDEF)-like protein/PAS domain S-box-containing protein [Paraburkholderia caledonica]